MVDITLKYNNARLYQESIVSLIERHNRYSADIDDLINELDVCTDCKYEVIDYDDKYLVSVNFPVVIYVINYQRLANIKSFTQSLK